MQFYEHRFYILYESKVCWKKIKDVLDDILTVIVQRNILREAEEESEPAQYRL